MIIRIKIEGYKSIKSLDLRLEPINILLGGNGVGKSNFISLFSLLKNIYNKNLEKYVLINGGADSFLYFGKKNSKEINIDISFDNQDSSCSILNLEESDDSLIIKSINTSFNDHLQEFDVYHFNDTGCYSPMKGRCNIEDNHKLNSDGSNIAAFLYYLKVKEPKYFKRIEMTIRSIAPFFDEFSLHPTRLNEEKIQLEWREKGFPDAYFNAYHLSDGTLRFICLATLLMQPNPPKTIIIDEPELGLHPVAINKLSALIRKVSAKTQVIVSTQSVSFIDNFQPEDIIVTDRKDSSSTFKRLDSSELSEWLQEYTLSHI